MKGVIYMRSKTAWQSLTDRYVQFDHELIFVEYMAVLEKELTMIRPDFAFLHCHTLDTQEDFERIRVLTHQIGLDLPACYVLIMHHPSVKEGYKSHHLNGYRAEGFISENFDTIYSLAESIGNLVLDKKDKSLS